jgi:enoyl-CoA hydratase/carnithine racemase
MPLARLGLVVPYLAASRLVQIAGFPAATDLLLSADLIDGERAYQLGLATHLVPEDQLLAAAMKHARRIAALAPLAVREIKRVLSHIGPPPPPAAYAGFDDARRRITASADTEEGLRAFLERRPTTLRGH